MERLHHAFDLYEEHAYARVGLFVIRNTLQARGAYTQTFAAMMIALVPILAVFIAFSNTIMENTVAGGLKG